MGFVLLLLVANFFISIFNAVACGAAWAESKHEGGFMHFMNWMGAIMSACGFTWCYLIVFVLIGSMVPVGDTTLLTPEVMRLSIEIGYLAIILPVIGSGLAITVDSWAYFYRRRTLGSGAVAAYNTYAQIHNMYDAVTLVPEILTDIGGSLDSDDDDEGHAKLGGLALVVAIVIVAFALCGGILTTRAIIMATARSRAHSHLYS